MNQRSIKGRKTSLRDPKHAVDCAISNLSLLSENNDAHSEPVKEILRTLVPCWCFFTTVVYIHDPNGRCFLATWAVSKSFGNVR